jgi:hypothetical protein
MRAPKHISPSSLARWEDRREEFYIMHLSEVRTERSPQQIYMAAGSAFDAFVKSRIHRDVFGEQKTKGSPYELATIFESQVESHVRDEAYKLGEYLMSVYIKTGAYSNLIADILKCNQPPQMEFSVYGTVNGVPITGKPDLRYVTKEFVHVIGDWKVNGSYSDYGVSPVQGYQRALSLKKDEIKTEVHKKYLPNLYKGVEINANGLDTFSPDWATQLTMYAWCLGEEPGDADYVVRMEQLACRKNKNGDLNVKVATHMSQIDQRFQMDVMRRLMDCWTAIQKGHIFTDLTLEESIEHCEMIDKKLETPFGLHPVMNQYLAEKTPRFKA